MWLPILIVPDTLSTVNQIPTLSAEQNLDGRNSRWETHRIARRAELISTARKAIHRLGGNVSMEEIAAECNTSKSVYYRYFGDKAGLQQAVSQVVVSQMQEKILSAAQAASSPRETLRAMISAYLQMAQTSPNVYAFVTWTPEFASPALDPDKAVEFTDFIGAISAIFAEPLGDIFKDSDGARGRAARNFWPQAAIGMVRAAGEQWIAISEGPSKPSEEKMSNLITDWLYASINGRTGND